MDGIVEQKSVLVHSKIGDAGKRNGLINTRNFMAESRDGLVSVYPAPQYQSHRLVANAAPGSLEGGRSEPVQQLLDPNTLQQSVESHYRPNIILYSDGVLRSWGDGVATDCCETTFIEDRSPTKDSLEYPDGKFIDLSADDIKIHTLSYDVEEEEELQELEVRGCACWSPSGMGPWGLGETCECSAKAIWILSCKKKYRRCSWYHFIPEHLQRMEGMEKDRGLSLILAKGDRW